jgi:pyruvate formate lyase activating enzyme
MYWKNRCLGCGKCVAVCPKYAVTLTKDGVAVDAAKCDYCGECAFYCNAEALTMVGKEMTVDEVMHEIGKDRDFYGAEGGVTFSGGEAFAQYGFLLALLKEAKARGYDTCIETPGYTAWERMDEASGYLDHLLYDFKAMDDAKHKELTGVSNERILDNYKKLVEKGCDVTARVPVIPGMNDSDADFRALAGFLKENNPGCRIDLLPYHRLGVSKYGRMNMEYCLPDIEPPGTERMEGIRDYLKSEGFDVRIGG